MYSLLGITLVIIALVIEQVKGTQDCTVSLPRLLLGNQYYSAQSNETALIIFDTPDHCDSATLIKKSGNFNFTLKDIVSQYVNAQLNHNGKDTEQVFYQKYSIIFAVNAAPGVTYTVGFQGDTTLGSIYSDTFSFTMPQLKPAIKVKAPPHQKILFFGDQDTTERGLTTLNYLTNNMDKTHYDAMVFLGDYAYEFYQNNGEQGDAYVNKISPLSFRYPLAMTPGNHEDNLNFTLFNEKFRLPAYSADNLNNYNSFDIGMIHFVHVNLHFFNNTDDGNKQKMLTWVQKDLASVNRGLTPWIIAVGHKPLYCYDPLTFNNTYCQDYAKTYQPIDSIFSKAGIDIFITGHEHYNQIMAPMAQMIAQDYTYISSSSTLSIKKGGFLSIIQGNGGCKNPPGRSLADLGQTLQTANLFLDQETIGYGWIEVFNQTYLQYNSYDATNPKVIKTFNIYSSHQKPQNTPAFSGILRSAVIAVIACFLLVL